MSEPSPSPSAVSTHAEAPSLTPTVRGSRWLTAATLLAGDLLAVTSAMALAVFIRKQTGGVFALVDYLALWPVIPVFLGLFTTFGLYAELPLAPANELKRMTQATTLGFIALAAYTFLARDAETWSRLAFLLAWLIALVAVPTVRATLRALCAHRSWWGTPVLLIGAGRTAEALIQRLKANPWLGLKPVLACDDDTAKHGNSCAGIPVVGALVAAPQLAAGQGIRTAIVAMPGADPARLLRAWNELGPSFPHLIIVPGLMGFASLWVEAKDMGGVLGLEVRQSLLLPFPRLCKRCLDVAVVLLFSPFVILLTLVLGIAIRLDSAGSIFYGQRRLGRDGKPFLAWKFRSMRRDADAVLASYLAEHPELSAEWEADHKLRNDPRITRVGRLLRKTSLDELPQLWNVFTGEMSLVGPRPIVAAETAKYGDHYALYTRVRPGLTGLWQVSGRNNLPYEERVALDAYYVRNWSVWLDLFIVAKTVRVVLRSEGAF